MPARQQSKEAIIHSTIRLPGLDGLRALAALAVLIYHAWPGILPGGFLGVDVFFILSGFLITSLLINDLNELGHIRLGRFWLRRWRRLFPAVFTVAIVTIPIATLISRNLIVKLPAQLAGTLTFSYNWVAIFTGSSYFEQMSPRLLTNMWTLAVEQQFYLLWPLVMLLIWKLPRRARPFIALTLAGVSVTLMAGYTAGVSDVSRAYMGTDSHSFGLMLGAALAIALGNPLQPPVRPYTDYTRHLAGYAGIASLAALGAMFAFASDNSPAVYPWGTLLAVLLAGVVIFSMTPPVQGQVRRQARGQVQGQVSLASALRILLELPALRWLGVRSYGVYLWHWPLLVIWWYVYPPAPAWLTTLLITILAVICAALSYKLVENPMRRRGIIVTLKQWFGMNTRTSSPRSERSSLLAHIRKIALLVAVIVASAIVTVALIVAPQKTDLEQSLEQGGANASESAAETPAPASPDKKAPSESAADAGANKTDAAEDAGTDADGTAGANGATDEADGTAGADTANKGPLLLWGAFRLVTKPEAEITGANITILGDSVIKGISGAAGEKWPDVVTDGEVSRSYYAIAPLIDSYAAAGQLHHYVIIGAANNGALPRDVIESWLKQIGTDRTLILITGHGNSRTTWIADSNANIAAAAQDHPQQIVVADWFARGESHPEWLYADLTHPNPDGVPPFVDMLADSLTQASKLPNAITIEKVTKPHRQAGKSASKPAGQSHR